MSTMEQLDEVLTQYGQTVDLYFRGAEAPVTVKAFFQPVLEEKKAQYLPTPVGRQRQDRFLYLGPADIPLTDIEYMEWKGCRYQMEQRQPVYLGENCSHWRAILRPDEVA